MQPLVAPTTYYTLSPGTYEYPFRFKVRIKTNSACGDSSRKDTYYGDDLVPIQ